MKSSIARGFRERLDALPSEAQHQAGWEYAVCRSDPYNPGLRFTRVSPARPVYSVRVGIGYRALRLR